jgi:hypothetical protein
LSVSINTFSLAGTEREDEKNSMPNDKRIKMNQNKPVSRAFIELPPNTYQLVKDLPGKNGKVIKPFSINILLLMRISS